MSFLEIACEGLVVSTDPSRLDLDATYEALSASDRGRDLTRPLLARAVEGSLCFGLYDGARQVGFARIITDRATFAYLCDVYVLPGSGAGDMTAAFVKVIRTHPDLQDLRRFVQSTVEEELSLRFFGTTAAVSLDATLSPPPVLPSNARTSDAPPPKPRRGPPPPPPPDSPEWNVDDSAPEAAPDDEEIPDDEGILVRPLAEAEGELLRQLRLGALHDSPGSFGERLEDAATRPAEEWVDQARTLADPDGPRLFIAEVDGEPAGLALVVEDPIDWDICRVGGMWVGPGKRRRGAGAGMLRAVRRWANERDKTRVRLWVHEDAASARSLYESFGFSYTGATKPFPREPTRQLLEMDFVLRPRARG